MFPGSFQGVKRTIFWLSSKLNPNVMRPKELESLAQGKRWRIFQTIALSWPRAGHLPTCPLVDDLTILSVHLPPSPLPAADDITMLGTCPPAPKLMTSSCCIFLTLLTNHTVLPSSFLLAPPLHQHLTDNLQGSVLSSTVCPLPISSPLSCNNDKH